MNLTKENAHWVLPLVQAQLDGKQVQFRPNEVSPWYDVNLFSCNANNPKEYFRIKPEPEYVPYTESDWPQLWGMKVRNKQSKVELLIFQKSDEVRRVNMIFGFGDKLLGISYEILLSHFELMDGSPCGKLKTE